MIHNLIIQLVVIDVMMKKCFDVVYAFLSFVEAVWMIDATEEENNNIISFFFDGLIYVCRNFEKLVVMTYTRRTSVEVSEVRKTTYLC